jgi:hypothetical protein
MYKLETKYRNHIEKLDTVDINYKLIVLDYNKILLFEKQIGG